MFYTDVSSRQDTNPEPVVFYNEGCAVRVVSDEGFPWFVLEDIVRELHSDTIQDEYDAGSLIDQWLGDDFLVDYAYDTDEDGEEYVYLTTIDGVNLLMYIADTWESIKLESTIRRGLQQNQALFSGYGFSADEAGITPQIISGGPDYDDQIEKAVNEAAPLEKAIIAANLTDREIFELVAERAYKNIQYSELFAFSYLTFKEIAKQCDDDKITDCFTDTEVDTLARGRLMGYYD